MRTLVLPTVLRNRRLWLLYVLWIWFGLVATVPPACARNQENSNINSKSATNNIEDPNENNGQKTKKAPEPNGLGRYLSFDQGVIMLNPYTIKDVGGMFKIDPNEGGKEHYYGEVAFRRRYAWFDREREDSQKPVLDLLLNGCRKKDWTQNLLTDLDLEARLGFALKEKKASGAAIVGSGDWYGEISCGYPLITLKEHNKKEDLRISLNFPEVMFSFVTDRKAQDIHDSGAVGAALVLAGQMKNPNENKRRAWECLFGFYYGWMETPQFDDSFSRIVKQERGYPEFENEYDAKTVRLDFRVPLGDGSYITIGGRWHLGFDDLNPWTVQIGLSSSLNNFGKALGKLLE